MSPEILQRIPEATTLCFNQQDYTGSHLQDICQIAQSSPATFYRYFNSKMVSFEAAGFPDPSTQSLLKVRE
jgi:AcrR family transcriptional regulator